MRKKKKMKLEQMSIFDLLGLKTPEIPIEDQKKGVRGWIIDISAVLRMENGWKENAVCVCTRPVIFEKDTRKDKDGRLWQQAKTTHGPSMGWMGYCKKVYRNRPTWEECVQYAQEGHKGDKVLYLERDGNWNEIWEFEKGYRKGA